VISAFSTTQTGLDVTSIANTTSGVSNYAWDFGDGFTGSGPALTHTFSADGTYTVSLIVENLCGQKDSSSQTLTVCAPLGMPSIGVSVVALNIGFTSAVTAGTPLQYYWNFGDNSTSSIANPNHIYALDGTYTVTLVVVNLCGDSVITSTPVEVCSVVLPQFTIQQTGNSITVDAWGTPGAAGLTFDWNFGDGNTGSGPIDNHTYAGPGTYVVTLDVLNSCGEAYSTTQVVKVCQPPVVDFTFKIISTGGNGMLVEFDASASQGASGYLWNFGDGNTSTTGPIVQHLYVTPGLFYVVKLTLSDTCGTNRSETKSLASVGTPELAADQYVLYPNPVKGSEALLAGWNEPVVEFKAYNALGQSMDQGTPQLLENGLLINCANWPVGVYLIQVRGSLHVWSGKLIISQK
jgi:PKD repeat protein